MGVMTAVGIATGYVCPIATVVKWFPGHKGLVCGIAAAGFGVGPIILSNITQALLGAGWIVYDIFGLVAATYMPIILVCGLLLATPGKNPAAVPSPVIGLRIAKERRFWLLFVGMFVGTLPYLLVTGNVERLGDNMGIGMAAAWGVTLMAIGNAAGRLFWGQALDRIGQRKAMFAAQMTMLAALLVLVILGPQPIVFLLAVAVIGFCYGSNFAIFPATVAAFYGSELLGTIYPLVMVAQSISSLGPVLNGVLIRQTGSYYWGLALAIGVAAAGLVLTWVLTRRR
jgi:MFS transporter, OFA family, oxalate/formate antiporter